MAVSSASFPSEMLSVTVVMLPKPGKETVSPQYFRLISLLNVDLKIYAKIRLACLFPKLIKHDHVGFILVRQAPDATRNLL